MFQNLQIFRLFLAKIENMPTEELKTPEKTLPLGGFIGLVGVTLSYFLCNVAYLMLFNVQQITQTNTIAMVRNSLLLSFFTSFFLYFFLSVYCSKFSFHIFPSFQFTSPSFHSKSFLHFSVLLQVFTPNLSFISVYCLKFSLQIFPSFQFTAPSFHSKSFLYFSLLLQVFTPNLSFISVYCSKFLLQIFP